MSVEQGGSEKGQDFLTEKYRDLPGSKEVESTVQKKIRQGEKGPASKQERVGAYLERLEDITENERGLELLSGKILRRFTIDTENEETVATLAEGLYESEKKIAIEQGRGADVQRLESQGDIVEKYKPLIHEKAEIQRKTLSSWLDYLGENDAKHPMWFRYFVVRNLQRMGTLDKEKMTYTKRTAKTIAPFPELNSEALGWAYKRLAGIDPEEAIGPDDPQADAKKEHLEKVLNAKDFSALYAFAQVETAGRLNRQTIEGQWRKYDQGSDWRILEGDLKGKGTGWCTAEGSAHPHLQGGDFYVYYSKGSEGQYTEPRVAIRMQGDQVGEVRGVNHRQELEPELVDIAQERYHKLPGGESYEKTASDMKQMTAIYNKCFKIDKETGEKTYLNPSLTKEELVFLYEIESKIQYFGYDPDPHIAEARSQRNPKEDAPIVLGCQPSEIARSEREISPQTKAYVGPLFKGIFEKLSHLEHIYTSFPEARIRRSQLEIGGKTAQKLERELEQKNFKIYDYARDMLQSRDFTTLKNPEQIDLVRLKVQDLGFTSGTTTDQIYTRAQELGLELCPAEVGPHQRLKDIDQPMGDYYQIAMKQITDRDGGPGVFGLERRAGGLWLHSNWALPGSKWRPGRGFVFRLRKSSPAS